MVMESLGLVPIHFTSKTRQQAPTFPDALVSMRVTALKILFDRMPDDGTPESVLLFISANNQCLVRKTAARELTHGIED
jgi:hypothetical protein